MPETLKRLALLALAASMAAGISSCGRKGNLERPSAYESQDTGAPAKQQQAVQDKKFFLDPLL